MSCTLTWRPIKGGKRIRGTCHGHVHDCLRRLFGTPPWQVHIGDINALHGLAAAEPENETFQHLVRLLQEHAPIEISAEW